MIDLTSYDLDTYLTCVSCPQVITKEFKNTTWRAVTLDVDSPKSPELSSSHNNKTFEKWI